jgi:molecular chaperone DnaK (HSP70)
LTGLTPNFASQVLEISIRMDIDANGILGVEVEESRSGAKAKITIDPKNRKNLLIEINIFFIDLYSL